MTLKPEEIGTSQLKIPNSKSVNKGSKSEQENLEKELQDRLAHPNETALKSCLDTKVNLMAGISRYKAQLKELESQSGTESLRDGIKSEIRVMESQLKELDKEISKLETVINDKDKSENIKGSKLSVEG